MSDCSPLDCSLTPLPIESSRREYWSGLSFSTPGDLPNPGIKPFFVCVSPALAGVILTPRCYQGSRNTGSRWEWIHTAHHPRKSGVGYGSRLAVHLLNLLHWQGTILRGEWKDRRERILHTCARTFIWWRIKRSAISTLLHCLHFNGLSFLMLHYFPVGHRRK